MAQSSHTRGSDLKDKAADPFNKVADQAEDMLSRITEQGAKPPSEWARSPATSRCGAVIYRIPQAVILSKAVD
jgi:hypothetical protein